MANDLIITAAVAGGLLALLLGIKLVMAAISGKLEKYIGEQFDPAEMEGGHRGALAP